MGMYLNLRIYPQNEITCTLAGLGLEVGCPIWKVKNVKSAQPTTDARVLLPLKPPLELVQ